MLVDANLLLFAVDEQNSHHAKAHSWLTSVLNGDRRVAFSWLSLGAFLRISTNPRAAQRPLSSAEAWRYVTDWLDCEVSWIPNPTARHAQVLGSLLIRYDLRANMVPDAQLAALAIEHGLAIYSADTDFARFSEVTWVNPIA